MKPGNQEFEDSEPGCPGHWLKSLRIVYTSSTFG